MTEQPLDLDAIQDQARRALRAIRAAQIGACPGCAELRVVLGQWRELARQYFEVLDMRSEAAAIDDVDQLRCCNHELGYIRGEIEKLLEVSDDNQVPR